MKISISIGTVIIMCAIFSIGIIIKEKKNRNINIEIMSFIVSIVLTSGYFISILIALNKYGLTFSNLKEVLLSTITTIYLLTSTLIIKVLKKDSFNKLIMIFLFIILILMIMYSISDSAKTIIDYIAATYCLFGILALFYNEYNEYNQYR